MPISTDKTIESEPGQYYFNKLVKRMEKVSKCKANDHLISSTHKIKVNLDESINSEGYTIRSTKSHVQIDVSSYTGYVYALETLAQIVKDGSIQLGVIQD